MKLSRFLLVGCLLLSGCYQDGLCIDKFVTSDAYTGSARYHVVVRDKHGDITQSSVLLEDYERAEKGRIFIFP